MTKTEYRALRSQVRLAWTRFHTERANGREFTWQDEERNCHEAMLLERQLPGGRAPSFRPSIRPLLDQFPAWAIRRQALRRRQEARAKARRAYADMMPWQRASMPDWAMAKLRERMA